MRFAYWNGLIYYVDDVDEWECLCILVCFEKKIFELIYNHQHHDEFHRIYDCITVLLFLCHLICQLKTYITHCLKCQLNQTKQYTPYGSLHLIMMSSISFYIIIMNFILILSLTSSYQYDNILTVTDKFIKHILLLSGQFIYIIVKWANILLSGLIDHDWGILHQIINDCDQKFLLSFWWALFERLGTKLLTFTVYHPQTDDQSEWINQMIEIALQYFLTTHSDKAFITVLLYLQDSLNNSQNSSTDYAPNELAYEFRTNDILDSLSVDIFPEDYTHLCQIYCEDTEQAIAFVNVTSKSYYNIRHTSLILESMMYLQLFHGYIIPELINKKLLNQHVGPFHIIEWIGQLAYWLKLLPIMCIHPVMSIAQLEPAPENNLYNWQSNMNSLFINIENKDNTIKSAPFYKIKCLLDKCITCWGCSQSFVQYLVKWKRYNHNHNVWYGMEDLAEARGLVENYERWIELWASHQN